MANLKHITTPDPDEAVTVNALIQWLGNTAGPNEIVKTANVNGERALLIERINGDHLFVIPAPVRERV
jgi:hypothetical protein